MSTESIQVMRVLDRYLDTAGPGSGPGPGVAAAAARAKADPDVHDALSQLLAEECPETSRESWRCGLAFLRERESGDDPSVTECGLRNRAVHDGVAAVRTRWRRPASAAGAAPVSSPTGAEASA